MYRVVLQVLILCMSLSLFAQDKVFFKEITQQDVLEQPVTSTKFAINQYNDRTTIAYGSGNSVVVKDLIKQEGTEQITTGIILFEGTIAKVCNCGLTGTEGYAFLVKTTDNKHCLIQLIRELPTLLMQLMI